MSSTPIMNQIFEDSIEGAEVESFSWKALITTLFLILGVAAYFVWKANRKLSIVKNNSNTIFIMGECGAGKTALLHQHLIKLMRQLLQSKPLKQISLFNYHRQNEFYHEYQDGQLGIGHNYSKMEYTNEIAQARGIIFMVDSANLNDIGNSVNYLYNLMIQRAFQEYQIPILLCANKSDLPKSLNVKDFEHLLVREIEKVKKSKRAIQEEDNELVEDYLKHQDSEFSFANNSQFSFCETSVIQGQIEPILQFLLKIFS